MRTFIGTTTRAVGKARSPLKRRKPKPRWQDLSPAARVSIVVLAVVQIGLSVAAWADLARRDPAEVRGPKWVWGLVISQNFIGPVVYFLWGRQPPTTSLDAG